ncbi:tRNA (guanosine(37)-N1)-methyltransferase TrmD [Effusibacillus lacus]|uniref:tRNA (guanine-N(1)-)-methyltransferase n=1 Tax=Effusibacillus lacus TaxID=1348429 RepID=A0A292YKC6_9BACL|nr:tRNA (guanosine(37)-N1)-methyltransferase TrmD [Effusibacillus lacus]TCS76596.1 tRNA (guanine37-N1)-methyltransferase [Effusibacillus lacus]GAX90388.1 tRNA (guanine(37)-N(1))-methyltransferase [Effusibacillus lacus]
MKIDIVTIFPEMFAGVLSHSIIGRARAAGAVEIDVTDFRDFSDNKHHTVDDTPYGGGGGMVLKPQPIFDAVESLMDAGKKPRVILTCPQGVPYTQELALELSKEDHLIIICGHYEGYDERIRQHLITDEISIGDYVLTGGEIPAMAIVDSVVRLLPRVLGNNTSAELDSFRNGLLEHPHYTRPFEFRGWTVPEILISGHHEKIEQWRRRESLRRTYLRRPDLLDKAELTDRDRKWLAEIEEEERRSPPRTS